MAVYIKMQNSRTGDVGNMKKNHSNNFTLFFLAALLFTGPVSTALATPIMLNFQIEDPLGGQYDNAEFSYIIDKETPFWTDIEGDTFGSQNRYRYNVEFYQADTTLGTLQDLTLDTTQMIGDMESGITDFTSGSSTAGSLMEIY